MIHRILVPLDGSETAEAILPLARAIAAKHHSELILLNVFVPFASTGLDMTTIVPELIEQSRAHARKAAEKLAAEGFKARGITAEGPAAACILDAVAREDASMIAMTTHGRSGIPRFVFGSVAEKVLRSSPVPLLLARSFQEDGRPLPAPRPVRKILVPLDGSGLSLAAVTRVCEVAAPIDARAVLLHVLPQSDLPLHWTPEPPSMKLALQELASACIPAETTVRTGDAAAQILDCAAEKDCDMIAMTTHGRSGPSRWIFGSVTEKVLRASPLPVFVIPRPAK